MRTIAWFFYSSNTLWPHSQDTNEVHQQPAVHSNVCLKMAKTNKSSWTYYTWNSIIIHVRKKWIGKKQQHRQHAKAETMKCLSILFSFLLNCAHTLPSNIFFRLCFFVRVNWIDRERTTFAHKHRIPQAMFFNWTTISIKLKKRNIIKKSCSKMQIWRLNFQ